MVRKIWNDYFWWWIALLTVTHQLVWFIADGYQQAARAAESSNVEKLFLALESEASPVRFTDSDGRIKVSIVQEDGERQLKVKFDECLYYGVWVTRYSRVPCPYLAEVTYHIDIRGLLKSTYVNCNGADEEMGAKLKAFRKRRISDDTVIAELTVRILKMLSKQTASQ